MGSFGGPSFLFMQDRKKQAVPLFKRRRLFSDLHKTHAPQDGAAAHRPERYQKREVYKGRMETTEKTAIASANTAAAVAR